MNKDSKIYVAGHRGMAGSAIVRSLERHGYSNFVFRSHNELDLRNQDAVKNFFEKEKPEYVFLAAARVGGILANNTYSAEFIRDNLLIETNVIHQSYLSGVKKLLFLGSSCIYPKLAPQPLKEEYLLSGYLESTNEAYAIAKIVGLKLCEYYRKQYGCNFISAMPTNLYGQNDTYDLEKSHVLPALIRKFHEAKINNKSEVIIWGTGSPRREFLHVDEMAEACIFLMQNYNEALFVNIGFGRDITINELAELIKKIVGFEGKITYDSSKPDGTPRKLMDSSRILSMGWRPKIDLEEGIKNTYEQFMKISAELV